MDSVYRTTTNRWLLAFMLVPFVMRFVLVWQKFSVLVKHSPLLEDDFFYYLNIARHVCAGQGLTADGHTPTTGFQWLHQLLCIIVTYFSSADSLLPFRLILTLQVLISIGCLALLMGTIRVLLGEKEAFIGGFVFSWWLPLFRYGNNGLETVLQIFTILLLVRLSYNFFVNRSATNLTLLALACALSPFVRIDMLAFPAAFIAAVVIARGRNILSVREVMKAGVVVASASIVAVCGYFLLNHAINGHLLPDSGVAVKYLANEYRRNGSGGNLFVSGSRRAASVLLGDQPYNQLLEVIKVPLHPRLELIAVPLVMSMFLMFKGWKTFSLGFRFLISTAAIYSAILVLFYSFLVQGIWYFSRYLFTAPMLSLLIMVPFIAALAHSIRDKISRPVFLLLTAVVSLWYTVGGTERWIQFMTGKSEQFSDKQLEGTLLASTAVSHPYDLGRWVRLNIPPESRVAMWQNGLAAYVSGRDILHLDGVVNRNALNAWTSNRMDEYLKDNAIDYLIDFRFFTDIILRHSQHPKESYALIGASAPTSSTSFAIAMYRVRH
jgi:hypothetical protein